MCMQAFYGDLLIVHSGFKLFSTGFLSVLHVLLLKITHW